MTIADRGKLAKKKGSRVAFDYVEGPALDEVGSSKFCPPSYLSGLMAGDQNGVEKAIEILKHDFKITVQLIGTRSIAEVKNIINI